MSDGYDDNFDAELADVAQERCSLWRTTYLLALARLLKGVSPDDAKRANEEALMIAKSAMDNYTVLFLQPVDDDDDDDDDDMG